MQTRTFAYHVTPSENLESITHQGLIPSIGERSSEFGEEKKAVYLFPDKVSMDNALGNWLGESFDDFESLAVLQVDITGLEVNSEVEWEIQHGSNIAPERIEFICYE